MQNVLRVDCPSHSRYRAPGPIRPPPVNAARQARDSTPGRPAAGTATRRRPFTALASARFSARPCWHARGRRGERPVEADTRTPSRSAGGNASGSTEPRAVTVRLSQDSAIDHDDQPGASQEAVRVLCRLMVTRAHEATTCGDKQPNRLIAGHRGRIVTSQVTTPRRHRAVASSTARTERAYQFARQGCQEDFTHLARRRRQQCPSAQSCVATGAETSAPVSSAPLRGVSMR